MSLESFVMTLWVSGYVLQAIFGGLIWLSRSAKPEVKAAWAPLSRTPVPVAWTILVLAALASVSGAIAAAVAGVFPATLFNSAVGTSGDPRHELTIAVLTFLSFPSLFFLPFLPQK